jgi:hypothetical protein
VKPGPRAISIYVVLGVGCLRRQIPSVGDGSLGTLGGHSNSAEIARQNGKAPSSVEELCDVTGRICDPNFKFLRPLQSYCFEVFLFRSIVGALGTSRRGNLSRNTLNNLSNFSQAGKSIIRNDLSAICTA